MVRKLYEYLRIILIVYIIILFDIFNNIVNKIMDSESIINNVKEENNLPPPSFSRVECPMDYGYLYTRNKQT